MFHTHAIAELRQHKKAATDDDMRTHVAQVVSCRPNRGFDYTGHLNIFAVNVPTRLDAAVSVAAQLLSREMRYARHSEVMITLCDTMAPVDHYMGNNFKYYFADADNLQAVIAAWITLARLRPILKILKKPAGQFSLSLQIYTKKQLWLAGFVMDAAYTPKPLQL